MNEKNAVLRTKKDKYTEASFPLVRPKTHPC